MNNTSETAAPAEDAREWVDEAACEIDLIYTTAVAFSKWPDRSEIAEALLAAYRGKP